jgi:tetratricopeptide (TPR) repeat protein
MKGFRKPAGGSGQVEQEFQRALDLHAAGRRKEAEGLLTGVLKKSQWHVGSLHTLGIIRLQEGRLEEALALFRKAVTINPGSAAAQTGVGNALQALGRHEEAIERYRRALTGRPQDGYAYNNLGNSYSALGRLEEAADCFRQAVARQPELAAAHGNLGNALLALNRLEEAVASYEAALALNPMLGGFHSNLGRTLVVLNRHEEAISRFLRARELDPEEPQYPLNLALARLALGDYASGWLDYEARWRSPSYSKPRNYPQPLWDGRADIAGKTIFLYFEQGLGDTIQFARYVPLVAQLGAKVILEVPKSLLRLFRSLDGPDALVTASDPPPDFDCHAPLLSLPLAFQTTLESVPAAVPYLHAAPVPAGCSTGICWAGNPSNSNDRNRSLPLCELIPLLDVPGVRFLSLQKVLRDGDQKILAQRENVDLETDRKGEDFADTAALVAGLDLVITVDTAVAHLAGALGRQVWVLLPFSAHWAWLRERDDSPWYPTARLFRQPEPGSWTDVVSRAAEALASIVAS